MRAQLLHLSGPLRGRTETYASERVLLGTDPHADVALPEGTPSVAARHALISFHERECTFHLRALDGRVFVNEHEVLEVILEPEDLIELGIDGPKARFRIHVEPGEFCKPVRQMLSDAKQVGKQSGVFAFVLALGRDLLTHATMTLKVGFPLVIVALVFVASYAGSWLGGNNPAAKLEKRYEQEIAQLRSRSEAAAQQQEQLRKEFDRRAALVDRWATENEALRRVLDVSAGGVCLFAGSFGFERKRDGSIQRFPRSDGRPLTMEYTGSGFLVSAQGHVMTNRHIVEPWWQNSDFAHPQRMGFEPRRDYLRAYFPGREPIEVDLATIRTRQDDIDVALLLLAVDDVKGIPIVPLSREDPRLLRGARVLVLGYPTGISALLARTDRQVAEQITSAATNLADVLRELVKHRAIQPLPTQGSLNEVLEKQFVYDASTTQGGSGGPVFGPDGKVIAVNFAILEGFAGSNFGVPIRFAVELLP